MASTKEPNPQVKLHVKLHNTVVGGESLWADRLPSGHFKVSNIPFFTYGLNLHDVVEAVPDDDGILDVKRVVAPSGHRTLRVCFEETPDLADRFKAFAKDLRALGKGISCEAGWNLMTIDIAPQADFNRVLQFLEAKVDVKQAIAIESAEQMVKGSFSPPPDDDPPAPAVS